MWRWARAISDPLEHLLNQAKIRHQPSYTAKVRIDSVNSLKNEKSVAKRKDLVAVFLWNSGRRVGNTASRVGNTASRVGNTASQNTLSYFIFFNRARDVKFLSAKIQFD